MAMQTSLHRNAVLAVLRGFADTGYLSPQQLAAMESILSAKASNVEPGKRWLTIDEACRYATVGRTTMWKYCNAGLLNVRKVGSRRLIEQGELDAFIQAGPPSMERLTLAKKHGHNQAEHISPVSCEEEET